MPAGFQHKRFAVSCFVCYLIFSAVLAAKWPRVC